MPKIRPYFVLLLFCTSASSQSPIPTNSTTPAFLNWPNRNPIGQIFLAYESERSPANPLGLINPATRVADAIANLKIVHGQALIFWDADGLHGPNSAGAYKGDPRHIPPMMDTYFKRVINAGIRVGVTLRCDTDYVNHADNPEKLPESLEYRLPIVRAKIASAKARGVTVFYCDSCPPLVQQTLAVVAPENPDCLFIPEQHRPADYAWGAPYMEFVPWSHCDTDYASNPKGFTVLCLVGDDIARQAIPKHHDEVLQRLKKGDVPLFRAWVRGPEFVPMVKLLQEADRPVEPLNPAALRELPPQTPPK